MHFVHEIAVPISAHPALLMRAGIVQNVSCTVGDCSCMAAQVSLLDISHRFLIHVEGSLR